jgi:hypothetical protein
MGRISGPPIFLSQLSQQESLRFGGGLKFSEKVSWVKYISLGTCILYRLGLLFQS